MRVVGEGMLYLGLELVNTTPTQAPCRGISQAHNSFSGTVPPIQASLAARDDQSDVVGLREPTEFLHAGLNHGHEFIHRQGPVFPNDLG